MSPQEPLPLTAAPRTSVADGDVCREQQQPDAEGVEGVDDDASSLTSELWQLLRLVIPTIVIEVGATMAPALTASYVGRHLGSVALDGFTLATLTGNLMTMALLWGLYSASDTLSPQAYNAGNYKEVGLIAMRGIYGSILICVPINLILWFVMDNLLVAVAGEDEQVSLLAAQWYRVYIVAMPFFTIYMVMWKFLSAQEVMMPLVFTSLVGTCLILPTCLHFLVPLYGFIGSAYSILVYQMAQAVLLFCYLYFFQPHHTETWPGLSYQTCVRDALDWPAFSLYLKLGAGGMLASGEWIWWEFISLLIGRLGIVALGVHTIATQVITVTFMLPYGIGTGLAIRVGAILPRNVQRAQQLVILCCMVSTVFFVAASILLHTQRVAIIDIFSADSEIQDGAEEIWWKIVVYFFLLCIFGIITGVATGLGMQWTLGFTNVVFLWLVSLPGLYWFGIVVDGASLSTAWSWIFPPYLGMNLVLLYKFWVSDWNKISAAIREREGMQHEPWVTSDGTTAVVVSKDVAVATEHTPLLV